MRKEYFNNYLQIGIVFLIFGYIFFQLVLAPRGWDALNFYIPNAFYFYLINDIPAGFNPLTFFPTFKPPANTIIMMFGFYLSGEISYELHPIIFLLGTAVLLFDISKEFIVDINYSYLGVILFLTLPLTFVLIYEYAYYQELPVLFFFSFAMVNLIKIRPSYVDYSIISLAITMAILSKMSGYSLIIIIGLSLPIGKYLMKIRYGITVFIYLFLIRKAVYSTYVLMLYPLFSLLVVTLYFQFKLGVKCKEKVSFKFLPFLLLLPVSVGIVWLRFMLQIPGLENYLVSLYIQPTSNKIITNFQSVGLFDIYLENGMSVSFISSIFYLFYGSMFGMVFAFYFIYGFYKFENYQIKLWLISFFSIWYSYFGTVSSRYLVPILVPYVIITLFGFYKFLNKFNMKQSDNRKFSFIILLSGINLTSIIPLFPFRNLNLFHNVRFYFYHHNFLLVFTYMILIIIISHMIIRIIPHKKSIASILLIFLVVTPFSAHYGIYLYSGFDSNETNSTLNYYSRNNYQNVIAFLELQNLESSEKIVSYNTPGLGYYILRSVLDLKIINEYSSISLIDLNKDQEYVRSLIFNESFFYLISLNEVHSDFQNFQSSVGNLTIYQMTTNTSIYEEIYSNPEYIINQLVV